MGALSGRLYHILTIISNRSFPHGDVGSYYLQFPLGQLNLGTNEAAGLSGVWAPGAFCLLKSSGQSGSLSKPLKSCGLEGELKCWKLMASSLVV